MKKLFFTNVAVGCTPGMQRPGPLAVGVDADASSTASIVTASDAWFRADFTVCLEELDRLGAMEPGSCLWVESTLLRARTLYRLRRYEDVITFIEPILDMYVHVDESCTARMLHAGALCRCGDVEHGLALLQDVAKAAEALHAHRAISAEIAHTIALAHWLKRELDEADQFASMAQGAKADVISVRAMQLRGFIEISRQNYRKALDFFRAAVDAYRTCRERDVDLAEMTVLQVASLEVTLRSAQVDGTHTMIGARRVRAVGERQPVGGSVKELQRTGLDAWLYAFDGERKPALRYARIAEDFAPNAAWHVWALANRAQITAAFGNYDDAAEFASKAVEIAGEVDWNGTSGQERVGLLLLAEVLASTDPLASVDVLARYDSLTSTLSPDEVFYDDPRLRVLEHFVRGLVKRIGEEPESARRQLMIAYRIATQHGIVWRAALALIELDATPTAATPRGDFYLEAAALLVRHHFPRSFLTNRLGRWFNVYGDPIGSRLTPAERDVLRHVLAGKVPKEIAALTGRAVKTVRNHIEAVLAAFEVHSVAELIVACYDRRLGPPPWYHGGSGRTATR